MTTRTPARFAVTVLAVLVTTLTVAACTKSSSTPSGGTGTTTDGTQTITKTPSSLATGPISTGKLVEKRASSCPILSFNVAKDDAGMRLDKITQVTQNGKFVGCRFYPAVFKSEHLPPPSQVAIEVLVSLYASPTTARDAFIRIATAGANPQQDDVATGVKGVCYQTTLWSPDKGKDWACTFSKGSKVVVIRTVVTDPAFNVVQIAKAVYPKV